MVRLTVILLILMTSQASRAVDASSELLAKLARTSTDLETIHQSVLALKASDREMVVRLINEASSRLLGSHDSPRLAEDLLIVYTAELGQTEKSNFMSLEKMMFHYQVKVQMAAAIFLRDHFSAATPGDGIFPLRPKDDEKATSDWNINWTISNLESMPKILAKLARISRNPQDTPEKFVADEAFRNIMKTLSEAAKDVHSDANATSEAMVTRRVRQRLAAHWLDELSKILIALRAREVVVPEQPLTAKTDGECASNLVHLDAFRPKKPKK